MGFDELLEAIGEPARRQREAIIVAAEAQAQAILGEAAARREATLRQALAAGEATARREAARILSQARLQARREIQSARHEILEAAFRAVERRLRELIGAETYPELLGRLLEEALRDADGPATVRCRPQDRAAVEGQARRLGRDISVEEDASLSFGGVNCALGPEGRVVCRNALADRMERIRPLLLQEASRLLFAAREGGGGP